MRTAIVGAGSMGLILGAYISKAGEQVDLVDAYKEHIQALKKNGATIVGKVDFNVPVSAMTPDEVKGKYDIIFLMTKQLFNKSVLESWLPHMNKDSVIVTLQNGLPELSCAEVVGENRVIGGAISWGATGKGPGVSELTSEPDSMTFDIGTINGKPHPKMGEVKRILECMCPAHVMDNFMGARWAKILINASFSGMSAVLGCNFGEAAANKKGRVCLQNIMKELIDVCKASGIKLEPIQGKDAAKVVDYNNIIKKKISFLIIPIMIKKHKLLRASMLQDLENGRKCEVDAINGVVCKFGRKSGVPTPYNDKVVEVIHSIEDGKRKCSFDNLKAFENL
ncbi:MAG: ketopantoate reductase family protein [Spirochaetota bacterium]